MNVLQELQDRFRATLAAVAGDRLSAGELDELAAMVRTSQDPKFGDYQANLAMPLAKKLGRAPRDVAADVVSRIDLSEICEPPEIAGPGFINLRLGTDWLARQLNAATADERLGIERVTKPRTIVVDYSAPNVAKPMHVGHIRSTVIGDSLYRTLKFLGHTVIGDNHIGDWGTQFGMIIYGYKHFLDRAAYQADSVHELSRLYRLVNRLVGYFEGRERLPELEQRVTAAEALLKTEQGRAATAKPDKKTEKSLRQAQRAVEEAKNELQGLRESLAAVESDAKLSAAAKTHPEIGKAVLEETAKLHVGDTENVALWREFLPPCLVDINRIYQRLGVLFDHTLGESFYHDRLGGVVEELLKKGIARRSEGAVAVFFDDKADATPFLIQKQDGAFLYGTSDLATIQYRMKTWQPDVILYVVDHRQSLHFEQLFATARRWGYTNVELQHISFGTVLGEDGRPFKTRTGDTVGLEGLLDEAVQRALAIVSANDDGKPNGPELSTADRHRVAEAVGIGALKYADLAQNRTSDYVFSYDKMLAMNGNTATYMQYAHARVRSIFAKGKKEVESGAAASTAAIELDAPAERALGLELARFSEALEAVVSDYRPNHLTNYLFELANRYSTFYEQCPVLKAETPERRASRLALCDLTARTLRQGLALLGIEVVEKM
ncbi:MAG TPA: arginine--tRNA ligase [Pirellulales bacterium]|nr:arginine--tRNA ligase [Pirellulales bacterium]